MNMWKRLSAGLMRGLVVPVAFTSAKMKPRHLTPNPSLPATDQFIVLFGPLTPEIVRKLPSHLEAASTGVSSPTNENRRLQRERRWL